MRVRVIFLSAALLLSQSGIFSPLGLDSRSVQLATAETQAATQNEPLLAKLPAELRDRGAALLNEKDDGKRARLADEMARASLGPALEFLLDLLESDSSSVVRHVILNRVGRYSNPKVRSVLERKAASDPNPRIATLAIEYLRIQHLEEIRPLLAQRLNMAVESGNENDINLLAQEQERWISLIRGVMLPSFMRTPPALFSVKPASAAIRVLAFGDFGTGSEHQNTVAKAMQQYHRKARFDFGLTLGDNFYSVGMESPKDPRWKTWWEQLYDPLGIKFYATLGNHDWGSPDSPAAELVYAGNAKSWRMPAPYYTFTAGPVQFFALDTNEISEAQLRWLKTEIAKSTSKWKVVYGHHPIYSAGLHGDSARLIAKLLPVLKGAVDVYLAGHDHDLQHLKPEGNVHFFVSGGGGAGIRPIKAGPRSIFAESAYGFSVLEADRSRIKVSFFGADLKLLYEYTVTK